MFVDASALVAILAAEPDAEELLKRLVDAPTRLTSAIGLWEAAVALARSQRTDVATALFGVEEFARRTGISIVSISANEAVLAVEAHARFGKGRHPARLNMGDCFACARARTHGVPLLYKGADFALTDIAAA